MDHFASLFATRVSAPEPIWGLDLSSSTIQSFEAREKPGLDRWSIMNNHGYYMNTHRELSSIYNSTQRIHGAGIFTYIYHKKGPVL